MAISFHRRMLAFLTLGVAAAGVSAADAPVSATPAPAPKKEVTMPAPKPDDAAPVSIVFATSLGDFTVELWTDKAPVTVANILKYVDAGFYDGLTFHRVIPGFVIQGGGMTPDMQQKKTNPPIKNECKNGERNLRGTLSMARTNDPNSATSQFFVNLVDNRSLDFDGPYGGYAVFGKVTAGMDVVDKIAKVQTRNAGMHQNVPAEPIIIKSVKRK